jgi:hypothetical protein
MSNVRLGAFWTHSRQVAEAPCQLKINIFKPTICMLFERSGGGNCEAISDVAERVMNFSILYTHYICGGVINFDFAY